MITKNDIKSVKSLQQKKYRHETGLFVVEGAKSVMEVLDSDLSVDHLYCTESFLKQVPKSLLYNIPNTICQERDLVAMGTFESNNAALAVVRHKVQQEVSQDNLTLLLDGISDPGNLGTIIRTADWFGIKDIVCSPTTTDFYNPKVINATMGSFIRINIVYQPLSNFLMENQRPVYGAFLGGEPLGKALLHPNSVLIIGNEANGISSEISAFVNTKITIKGVGEAESLNAAIAAAILMYEIKG